MARNSNKKQRRAALALALSVTTLVTGVVSMTGAYAKGGTAKPPPHAVTQLITATLGDPTTSVPATDIHGFDDSGFIQDATVSGAGCKAGTDPANFGGTVTLNNLTTVVPCNTIIQMPANTISWADFINGIPGSAYPMLATTLKGGAHPSFEIDVVGNLVGTKRIAGLITVSQQSLNGGNGVIQSIDYSNGNLLIDTGGATPAVVQINDPKGRFGRAQSPDERFSVDDANPTIHAATGYPMCVPRFDPSVKADDLCPQQNRPKAAAGCRKFSQAAVALPASGELGLPAAGQVYCSQYVMNSVAARLATDPDPRQQAPFEVGDWVSFSGTLVQPSSGPDYTSAHTIEANLGIYTQPGFQPSYLAIGEFGVGTADPNATAISLIPQETQDRMFLEAETTDVKTPVDIYYLDTNPTTTTVKDRWVTPGEMTGEDLLGTPGGGITTQNTGAQPQRARIRATKSPSGLLSQPTRTLRVMARSLCTPTYQLDQSAVDACVAAAPTVSNGLVAGQYVAPVFEFIFPENVKPGDGIVPNDFWHLPFLRNGESPTVGALDPAPW